MLYEIITAELCSRATIIRMTQISSNSKKMRFMNKLSEWHRRIAVTRMTWNSTELHWRKISKKMTFQNYISQSKAQQGVGTNALVNTDKYLILAKVCINLIPTIRYYFVLAEYIYPTSNLAKQYCSISSPIYFYLQCLFSLSTYERRFLKLASGVYMVCCWCALIVLM
jgi:hypothetical protein